MIATTVLTVSSVRDGIGGGTGNSKYSSNPLNSL